MRDFDFERMPMRRASDVRGDEWSAGNVVELIIRIALVAVFVWAVVMLVRYSVKYLNARSTSHKETPLEIAKRRFASGDISKDEFESIKKELK